MSGSVQHPPARRQGRYAAARVRGVLALALAGVMVAAPALADDLDEIRDRIERVEAEEERKRQAEERSRQQAAELDEELDHTGQELVEASERLARTTEQVAEARVALAEAEADLTDAEAEAERIEAELGLARADEERIEERLAQNEEQQAESRDTVGAIARESYKQGGMGSLASTLELLSGESDAVDEMSMARTVLRVQDQQIRALAGQEAEHVVEQDRLAGVRGDIAYLLARAEAMVVAKEEARAAAEAVRAELEELEARQAREKEALEEEKARVAEELAGEQRRSDDLAAELAELAETKHGLKADEQAEEERIAEAERRAAEEAARRKAAEEAARKAEEEALRKAAEAEAARQAAEQAAAEQAAEERARQRAAEREAERQRQAEADAQRRADEQAAAEARRRAEAAAQEAAAAERAAQEADERQAAEERERQVAAEAESERRAQVAQVAAQTSSGFLSQPVAGGVTSEFGMRLHPILGVTLLHSGIDFSGGCGAPITAAADGVVHSTPYDDSRGNYVVLDHGIQRGVNLTTAYLHLQSFAVSPGQSVSRGQVVGYEGTTGSSTGCHLHFETRENGAPVNPRIWL
ncbi:peptidoglycan DD-metalloendopeptidase family protein [Ornithinimicrobium sp. W1679]|uniref:M23 family metallopeptidase n=1 Tax=Ornithinimicrobium sp. W1679 TaxID=3418770 RepID=UPI003CED151A